LFNLRLQETSQARYKAVRTTEWTGMAVRPYIHTVSWLRC